MIDSTLLADAKQFGAKTTAPTVRNRSTLYTLEAAKADNAMPHPREIVTGSVEFVICLPTIDGCGLRCDECDSHDRPIFSIEASETTEEAGLCVDCLEESVEFWLTMEKVAK